MSYNILITGAKGFVGQNFVMSLKSIKEGKDKNHIWNSLIDPTELNIYEFDIDSSDEELDKYCQNANFVFNFAGVNRPQNNEEFMQGNFGFATKLLNALKKHNNICPVMLSSSIQANLEGRYAESDYGKSKLAGENLFRDYSKEVGAKVLIYRLPNLFGKWCKPNYNSAVATFCHNIANDLDIQVNDRDVQLNLVYIDDLMEEMFCALNNKEHVDENGFCYVPNAHNVTLGEIVDLLYEFKNTRNTLQIPNMRDNSFSKKLYSTYLTYLPADNFSYPLKMNIDDRGSFTEILKTLDRGQVSVNISKPSITKGQHWHHTKNEKFIVVSGKGLIQLRKIGIDPKTGEDYPVVDYYVNGDEITVVDMIPGYTHNIINLSGTQDLVTIMWCNECFDVKRPDTFFEEVEK